MQQQLNDFTVKFFRYIDSKLSRVDKRFTVQDAQIDGLYRLVDSYAKQVETSEQEALIGDAKVNRLEHSVMQLSEQYNKWLEMP